MRKASHSKPPRDRHSRPGHEDANSPGRAAANDPGRAQKRTWLFKLIAIALPFLLLALLETSLRIAGYGHDYSLFIHPPESDESWMMNPYAGWRYFPDSTQATAGYAERFAVQKPANTYRIFVLGESTTVGYPYFHNGSFHRWLQYRLMHDYPRLHFEIVNCSLTAVSSYTVLDFTKRVLNYSPDAILVYAGHNEYYGALGVGSTTRIGHNRWWIQTLLALRELRTIQLLDNLFHRSSLGQPVDRPDQTPYRDNQAQDHDNQPPDRDNLMRRMAADQQIPQNSATFRAGVEQYAHNMDEVCRLCNDHNVPLFLGTLVSNERDLPPFVSEPGDGDSSAASLYAKANAEENAKQYVPARLDYIAAKDKDLLRFRAPSAMDSVLSAITKRWPKTHLADVANTFRAHSPKGIIGKETILEHVHPNLYGYALMSDAYYQSIQQAHLLPPPVTNALSFDELLQTMPVTKVDSLTGAYRIMMLKTGWPFNQPLPVNYRIGNSLEEKLAGKLALNRIDWLDAMQKLYLYYKHVGDQTDAAKVADGVLLEHPELKTR